ncbi:hypothetical protein P43SY_005018 [Pythium insidiosum]|uniref:Uncharacterized protein n=1 Tax=Pythium insidiosum TaxID=114742 RepID=A0AAD5MH19_PYTIN|nr:hypothetical protein P43SY_005018 [Pythium insidiosum]KAJ0411920.1 hypothetical protein ATCC90586_006015 [Pythium insidiosum]
MKPMDVLSLENALALQSDKLLGVTLTAATGLVTVLGALIVYSSRLTFLWDARSLVVALGLATGGVLSFTLLELLPTAKGAFVRVVQDLLDDARPSADAEQDPRVRGYAALILAAAFAVGATTAWVADTLCMLCSVPERALPPRPPRDETMLTTRSGSSVSSRRQLSPSVYRESETMGSAHVHVDGVTKELLYKTGTAKVIAFTVQNVPEGMALCIATVQHRTLGILFACAIALLNVTQGMALAGLLAQSSGYRWRAVLWCVLLALALPLGGLLAWVVLLYTELTSLALGVVYGIASGMLIGMSLTQILTVCYNFSASDSAVVTRSVFGGVFFIAALRVLLTFVYAD